LRRYYPGFFGALFLVLLRTAIGWHFFYEGYTKQVSGAEGQSFSAEGYLRGSAGPLSPYFHALVPDYYSLSRLDQAELERSWDQEVARIADHYQFDEAQREDAEKILASSKAKADAEFADPETIEKIKKFRTDLDRLRQLEASPPTISFERERAEEVRKKVDTERRELVATVDAWEETLREGVAGLVTPEQAERIGPPSVSWTRLDWINFITKVSLLAIGACLMLGLLTPLASLGGAAFLALIYLSMPPWPGLPANPLAEGHYLYVNKNLIELLACLVLASTPNGLWIGLDALLFGWVGRRRARRAEAAAEREHDRSARPARI